MITFIRSFRRVQSAPVLIELSSDVLPLGHAANLTMGLNINVSKKYCLFPFKAPLNDQISPIFYITLVSLFGK